MLKFCLPLLIFYLINISNSSNNQNGSKQQNLNSIKHKRQLKILLYSPSLSWSHAQFVGRIADTLVEAGHEVHFLKYALDPLLNEKNETNLVDKIIVIKSKEGITSMQKHIDETIPSVTNAFTRRRPMFTIIDSPAYEFAQFYQPAVRETMKQHKLFQTLTKEDYDVGIAEMYDYIAAAIFHKIGVKTKFAAFAIPLSPTIGRGLDIPTFASYVPNTWVPTYGLDSSFIARFINFYNEFFDWLWIDNTYLRLQEPIIRSEFGGDFPNLKQLVKNVSLIFVNSNPFLEMPRPISNKIVYIGGLVDDLASEENKKLEPKIKNILDKANKGGAILFSLGSITDTTKLNNYMRDSIIGVFKHFTNIQFIWKVDNKTKTIMPEMLNSITNLHTVEWLRQQAILAHPNIKLFITHCGHNSLTESMRAGVPIIGIPLFGDQFYNAGLAEKRGLGLQIDVNDLSSSKGNNVFIKAIERVLQDPSFHQNAKILSKKLLSTPFKPKERLVKWVEFAAEFNNLSELDLPGDLELNWFIYYSIDVILFSIIFLFIIFLFVWKFTKWILFKFISILFSKNTKMKELKKIN